MSKFSVRSLEELAFEVSYNEILCNLLLCNDHRPNDKKLFWATFSSYVSMNSFLTSQNMVKFVRCRLNYHLIGIMGDAIRDKFIQKFNHDLVCFCNSYDDRSSLLENIPDLWVFLDSVLDESFVELETYIGFPDSDPNPKLIPTIAKRCPLLNKLKINFKLLGKEFGLLKMKPLITPLVSLEHLTHLNLFEMNTYDQLCVLRLIGNSCPSLSHLSVSKTNLEKSEILALVLGELVDELLPYPKASFKKPIWYQDSALQNLVIPAKLRSSFCSSLEDLQLSGEMTTRKTTRGGRSGYYYGFSASTAAFILRHFPYLQNIGKRLPTGMAIKILHDAPIAEDAVIQAEFEKHCREVAMSSHQNVTGADPIAHSNQLIHSISAFSGSLRLTKLDFITVLEADMLRAIGSMCPSLKDVTFSEVLANGMLSTREPKRNIPGEDLQAILSQWPKLDTIRIIEVSPKYVKSILKVFATEELKHLTFEKCDQVNLVDLAPCNLLESLSILCFCTLNMKDVESTLTAADFLSNLKSFKSEICLGRWSKLFEEKSRALIHLSLNCCHIGLKGSNDKEWSGLSQFWPVLEHLEIKQCPALTTVDNLFNFRSQLGKLKEITFPDSIKPNNEELSHLMEKLSNRSSPIMVHFKAKSFLVECAFMN